MLENYKRLQSVFFNILSTKVTLDTDSPDSSFKVSFCAMSSQIKHFYPPSLLFLPITMFLINSGMQISDFSLIADFFLLQHL